MKKPSYGNNHSLFKEEELQWYFRKSFIGLAIFLVGPLALPLIWFRPQTALALKIGVTFGMLLLLGWIFWPGSNILFFG